MSSWKLSLGTEDYGIEVDDTVRLIEDRIGLGFKVGFKHGFTEFLNFFLKIGCTIDINIVGFEFRRRNSWFSCRIWC